jgi:hypothetical protein
LIEAEASAATSSWQQERWRQLLASSLPPEITGAIRKFLPETAKR